MPITRFIFLWLINPFLKIIGKIHIPVRRRRLEKHIAEIKSLTHFGDIVIAKQRFALSNLFIKGKYKHAALITFNDKLVDAVAPYVRRISIDEFCRKYDTICILNPNFLNDDEKKRLVYFVESQVGVPYDYFFARNDNWYCSELISTGIENIKGKEIWTNRDIFGVKTTVPMDFYDSSKFNIIKEF